MDEIFFKQFEITRLKRRKLQQVRTEIGMVYQYSALLSSRNVRDNVALALEELTKKSTAEIDRIVDEKLELVGMLDSKEQMPSELSGGMRKRVSLARALVLDPELILFDEPSAGLDPVISSVIDELIISLTERSQTTSIIVTHEMESAFRIGTRMAMLYEGKVIEDAAPDGVQAIEESGRAAISRAAAPKAPSWREVKMQLRRNEIMTGLLVLVTVAVLTFILVLLGAPGLFRPLVIYRLYFDNAAGIKLGAPVLLAGRKVGQVKALYSPVSREEAAHAIEAAGNLGTVTQDGPHGAGPLPRFEVRIDVEVDRNALIYKNSNVSLTTLGLLGDTIIDIAGGNDHSSRAEPGQVFVGNRIPNFSEAIGKLLGIVQPVATEATATLKELQNDKRQSEQNHR